MFEQVILISVKVAELLPFRRGLSNWLTMVNWLTLCNMYFVILVVSHFDFDYDCASSCYFLIVHFLEVLTESVNDNLNNINRFGCGGTQIKEFT